MEGEERILSGFADYSLFYVSQAKQAFGTNLVIMEAKKTGCRELGVRWWVCGDGGVAVVGG